jgi:hypothetical protein
MIKVIYPWYHYNDEITLIINIHTRVINLKGYNISRPHYQIIILWLMLHLLYNRLASGNIIIINGAGNIVFRPGFFI